MYTFKVYQAIFLQTIILDLENINESFKKKKLINRAHL